MDIETIKMIAATQLRAAQKKGNTTKVTFMSAVLAMAEELKELRNKNNSKGGKKK
jgi:hypothetical protein